MIINRWQDAEARAMQEAAGADPMARELALRVYTSRIIGQDPDLVMHGGGNTSVKLRARDVFGDEVDVIHIKGSGWDLGTIAAAGLPAVRMAPLMRLRDLPALSDEEMVNVQRSNLLDSTAPNPSVETLLHAYLPHKYVDHTHATAMLALANLPEVEAATREIFGGRMALVPYVMPGFALAKLAAETFEGHPDAEGLLLVNHGHFAWGPDAKSSYDRIVAHTNMVEAWLADRRPEPLHPVAALPQPDLARTLSALRGAIGAHLPDGAPMPVFDLRSNGVVDAFLARPDLADLATRGVATPDHVIRTKGHPLVLDGATVAGGAGAIAAAVDRFVAGYTAYFGRQAPRFGGSKTMLSPLPNLAWIVGAGLVGIGADAKAARIAADIGEQSQRVMRDGEAAGGFRPIAEADLFDMEYWSLEQAKLGKGKAPVFQGRVVLVTGGAGAIGLATARAFKAQGATVFLVDRDAGALETALQALGGDHGALACDITETGAAEGAVAACVARFGGLDILVSNAGAAMVGEVATLPDDTLRASFELNFFAHLAFAQAATAVFRAQGRGGQILFNVSKQAVNPGKGFAAYGLPKATTFFLLRQLALELGAEGIRVNGINADRIRSGLLTPEMIAARASARQIDEASYMGGNLLHREVEAHHVAEGFVMLAQSERTTAHVLTVDGGNIEAALR
ncbi:rhamnose utilization protein RhaD (predicted bifunctional aldolase and dehydrogenase) [Defluviimonas denitrificans]|jgi:rhamnose utilization protein RhaD (predicted bifunctional aldolase and dehydrogenase)/NAD(P)-dependent dehydrogenase (short-subunit alcohol dehydrogenase family)|uniref:Rhamnose utilization protein RhaD (Predicted bifunctional aldolase and dehydrogenase) n=1 Tax=Albidovulum denitrificans TaxID=404881 RepID=A0A2S8S8E3_9RHOB|nr:bifunctional aldolase/short-chain dehydrogenase [Defluviimonas denitrificans]PQV57064.1 rhamnose utilization protein RhaD (predicted bifunctional aldolase and dehydrogenase) [Defluviimonas denitrificans]